LTTVISQYIVEEVEQFRISGRSDSAAFLAWFLTNLFRVDEEDSRDAVCDSVNDKGLDGILVDEQTTEIILFQAKFRLSKSKTQGDKDLRDFAGAAKWFQSSSSVRSLIDSTASEELKSVVRRLDLPKRLDEGFSIRLVFISSLPFDANAKDFIRMYNDPKLPLVAWDVNQLNSRYATFARAEKIVGHYDFDLPKRGYLLRGISGKIDVMVAPLKAVQLVQLEGIGDRSLFARNVRFGLGNTRINRDIKNTILDKNEHENFFLYHNGVTLLCDRFKPKGKKLRVWNYAIVNGCQSLISFYDAKDSLSDKLLVPAKVVMVGPKRSRMAEDITYYNNNQNSISMKDLRSNDRTQVDLQRQFSKFFGDKVFYRIKRGEEVPAGALVIENDLAAQLILSTYCEEPENAHQKYKLFDQNYSKIFHRNIGAEHIYFAHLIYSSIGDAFRLVDDPLVRDYKLAKFFVLHLAHAVLNSDSIGRQLLVDPRKVILKNEAPLRKAIKQFVEILVTEFNYLVKNKQQQPMQPQQQAAYFDYKSDLKSKEEVRKMTDEIVKSYNLVLVRHPEDSFSRIITRDGKISPNTLV
jgi:hypothetical protein